MATATKTKLYRVRGISLGYGSDPITGETKMFDRGQVFELNGQRNDQKLIELRYLEPFEGSANDLFECSECGGKFTSDGERTGHGNYRHPRKYLTPYDEDSMIDRQERVALEVAGPPGRPEPVEVR